MSNVGTNEIAAPAFARSFDPVAGSNQVGWIHSRAFDLVFFTLSPVPGPISRSHVRSIRGTKTTLERSVTVYSSENTVRIRFAAVTLVRSAAMPLSTTPYVVLVILLVVHSFVPLVEFVRNNIPYRTTRQASSLRIGT